MLGALVDFHCHLDLFPDHATAIAECEREGIFTLAVTTTPKAWPRNRDLTSGTKYVRAALGLHPQLVSERVEELSLWERYLPEARYVGETGLDAGPRFYKSIELQKQVFQRILIACADVGGRILTVHSVRASAAVLDLVEAHLPAARGCVVLHWFSGSKSEAKRAVELGCYFSVNAQMLRSQHAQEIVEALPLDRILTETDGPFTEHDGRPARPADVGFAVNAIARARQSSPPIIADAVRTNLRSVLSNMPLDGATL
jgi:TatD DNase family protein